MAENWQSVDDQLPILGQLVIVRYTDLNIVDEDGESPTREHKARLATVYKDNTANETFQVFSFEPPFKYFPDKAIEVIGEWKDFVPEEAEPVIKL